MNGIAARLRTERRPEWLALKSVTGSPELHLKPGKQKVQALVYAFRAGDPAGQPVRVFSNPLEIEIDETDAQPVTVKPPEGR